MRVITSRTTLTMEVELVAKKLASPPHVVTDFIALARLPREFTGMSSFAYVLSWNSWNM